MLKKKSAPGDGQSVALIASINQKQIPCEVWRALEFVVLIEFLDSFVQISFCVTIWMYADT